MRTSRQELSAAMGVGVGGAAGRRANACQGREVEHADGGDRQPDCRRRATGPRFHMRSVAAARLRSSPLLLSADVYAAGRAPTKSYGLYFCSAA